MPDTCGMASSTWLTMLSVSVAAMAPTGTTARVATNSPIAAQHATTAAYLTASRRPRRTGTTRSERRVPRFASPATESPEMTETASGRNSGSTATRAVSDRNRPLPAIRSMNCGPSPGFGDDESLMATPMSTGIRASTASSTRLRRRRKTSASSERRKRPTVGRASEPPPDPRAGAGAGPAEASWTPSSGGLLVDIESPPGGRHVGVLQRWALHSPPPHRHARADQRGAGALGRHPVEDRLGRLAAPAGVAAAEPGEHAHRQVRIGGVHVQPRLGVRTQLRQAATGDHAAGGHDRGVGADLLHLAE